MLTTIGIGLCCVGACCAVGGKYVGSRERAGKRRAAKGFRKPTQIGARSFEHDLPFLPERIRASAELFRKLGKQGDDLVIAVLRDVYPTNNFRKHIHWPVSRNSPLALTQEQVRREVMKRGR